MTKFGALLYVLFFGTISAISGLASAQDPEWNLIAGNVGVGTGEPAAKLHVEGTEQTRLLVENTDPAATGDQIMFELRNASNSKLRFAITSAGNNVWTFDNDPGADTFGISKVGTGLNEFIIFSNGDGTFRGVSRATQHINTSSRSVKTDFGHIDTLEILSRVISLPVAQWRYRSEDDSVRHIGPVAEDFQEILGIGDGKSISTVDASGIAFVAIQGLNRQLLASNAELESRILEQGRRISRLESAIESLTSRANQ